MTHTLKRTAAAIASGAHTPCSACIACIACVCLVASCRLTRDDEGLFVDPRDDYLDAETAAPLVVPEDLLSAKITDAMPIPEIVDQPITKVFPRKAPRPEVLVGRDFDAVRIQSLGDDRWIVLGDAPEQVWPMTKQFLADNGVALGREDPPAGLIESAWIVVGDDDYGDVIRTAIVSGREKHVEEGGDDVAMGRDRLRFRVERGIRRGSTEVHVEHDRAEGVSDETAPAVIAVEAEVTTKLAEYFAAGVNAAVSMVGRDIASASKAQIFKDATGYPALRLFIGFERAWATVGQALERAEIEAESNRAEATYQVVFPTAGPRGWLRRVVPGGESGRNTPVSIHVEMGDDSVVINVSQPDGEPLGVELAEEVLVTLREFAA